MRLTLKNERATEQFAEDFALCLRKGDLVTLSGDLGAGKSTLARALIRALADNAKLAVPSPTFTLVQTYEETRIPLAHADIYRLNSAEELTELGLEEARQNGIVLVEWPEKAGRALADAQFALKLEEEGAGSADERSKASETRRKIKKAADERSVIADGAQRQTRRQNEPMSEPASETRRKENDSRIITVAAAEEALKRLEHSMAIRDFLREHGRGDAARRYLQGDASPRRYEKLIFCAHDRNSVPSPRGQTSLLSEQSERDKAILKGLPDAPKTEILMDAPILEIHDAERAAYIKRAHLAENNHAFIAIDELLIAQGFKAPAIYAKNQDETLLILEDLGREGILTAEGAPDPRRYLAAAEFLAEFHKTDWQTADERSVIADGAQRQTRRKNEPMSEVSLEGTQSETRRKETANKQPYRLPLYDIEALNAETDLFIDWYVPYKTGKPADKAFHARWRELWQPLFAKMQEGDKVLVIRDFHSPNILWQEQEQGVKRIGLIDFQDAALGQAAYDVVSLAQDARADISPGLEHELKTAYTTARHAFSADFNETQFEDAYAILGAQRAAKILGIFVRLKMRDGKDNYLRHLPRIADYFARNLRAPVLAELHLFLREYGLADE